MKWRYILPASIRDTIRNGTADLEGVKNSTTTLLTHLKWLMGRVKNDSIAYEEIGDAFEELIDHIDFDRQLADGTISKDEWEDFEIESESEIVDMFNGHLNEMFDLFDTHITKNEKFCFLDL